MKRLLLVLVVLGLITTPALAADFKVGVVDLQKALNLSVAGKDAKEKIKVKFMSMDAEVKTLEAELTKLKESAEKQAMALSEKARTAKEREYQQKVKDYQRFKKDAQDELQREDAEFTRVIIEGLLKTAQGLGSKNGYTVILEKTKSAVIFSDKSVDLTDQLIKAFDAKK